MPQDNIVPDWTSSEIKIPEFHPELLTTVSIFLDGERRDLTPVQNC